MLHSVQFQSFYRVFIFLECFDSPCLQNIYLLFWDYRTVFSVAVNASLGSIQTRNFTQGNDMSTLSVWLRSALISVKFVVVKETTYKIHSLNCFLFAGSIDARNLYSFHLKFCSLRLSGDSGFLDCQIVFSLCEKSDICSRLQFSVGWLSWVGELIICVLQFAQVFHFCNCIFRRLQCYSQPLYLWFIVIFRPHKWGRKIMICDAFFFTNSAKTPLYLHSI